MAFCVPALLFTAFIAHQSSEPPAPQNEPQRITQRVVANVDMPLQNDLRRLFEDVGMDNLLRLQVDQLMAPVATMLKANPQLTPAFVDECLRRGKEKLLDGRVQDLAIQEYAKFFTRVEIQQMIAYQESPTGRKARQVMPQMMSELGSRMQAEGESIGREIAIEVAREHPEYINKPETGAVEGGVIGGVIGRVAGAPPPPPPPKGVAPTGLSQPFTGERVDAKTEEARLIKKVEPEYPPLAKSARVQGSVRFTVIIGTDGKVESLTLISGHPLLVNAAKAAVLEWEYEPTIVAGKQVKVITEVEVNFHLASDQ